MVGARAQLLVAEHFLKTGGMDRANYALADFLARAGAPVHLVGYSAAAALRAHANVHWHRVARPLRRDALGWWALDFRGRRWARRLAVGGGRVFVNGGNCRWNDVNWVHYVHAAFQAECGPGPPRLVRKAWHQWKHHRNLRAERRALLRARVVIANSERTRRDLVERVGVAGERVHTVYYGCDAERFRPVSAQDRAQARAQLQWPARPVAIFIGALGDRRKGFDTVFAAWLRLCGRAAWTADLVVVGAGAELPAWRHRARAAGIGSRCRFLGFRPDVPVLLRASDVMIAPSRYEAYGLAVHEALACGLPAIVSAQAGVAERVPAPLRDQLCLLDPDSALELEARLLDWNRNAPQWQPALDGLGASLRAWSWDAMAARIIALAESA